MSSRPRISIASYLIGGRYKLQRKLGEGGMGAVYQAEDKLTGVNMALKRVRAALPGQESGKTSRINREALSREFQILASFHHPHIVRVFDFGYDDDQRPYFTMNLLESPRTLLEAAASLDLNGKAGLLLDTLEALGYLHRQGILHGDLKPSNILVDAGQRLKVVDFGLAVEVGQPKNTLGTLRYMAPETLSDGTLVTQSDLYALGVLAYEMFAGRHPFDTQSLSNLIIQTIRAVPDLDMLRIPEALRQVVHRLLEKRPEARFKHAIEAADAIQNALGRPTSPISGVPGSMMLHTVRFVGREPEFARLDQALDEAIQGRGSAWLIGGESGVGKSRFLDEIRIRTLVKGMISIQGRYSENGGAIFHFWRLVLRRLVLLTAVTEREAQLLKVVIPDLDALLEYKVASAPLFGLDDSQMVSLVTNLLKRWGGTLVLLIDDLHWIHESLIPLKRLAQAASELPLMIVATYRSDEAHYFYGNLREMNHVILNRFSPQEIRTLTGSLAGDSAATPAMNDFLFTQTEGNPFFLIESLRTLAEMAGGVKYIRQIALPGQLFSEGMLELSRRRLRRLAPAYQALLKAAAVIGREIDFDLLELIAGAADYDDWLMKCVDSSLLRFEQGKWHFAHDKIREGILRDLTETERTSLHQAAARGIERLYPHILDRMLSQAIHWREAGDLEHELRALVAYAPDAVQRGALLSLQPHLLSALHRATERGLPDLQPMIARLYIFIGQAYSYLSQHFMAEDCYRKALGIAVQHDLRDPQSKALRLLGQLQRSLGQFESASASFDQALKIAEADDNPRAQAEILADMGTMFITQAQLDRAQAVFEASLRIAQAIDDSLSIAAAYVGLSEAVANQGRPEEALDLAHDAERRFKALGHQEGMNRCLKLIANVETDLGHFDVALARLEEARNTNEQAGDFQQVMVVVGNIAYNLAQQQRYEQSRQYFEESIDMARRLGYPNSLANRLAALAQVQIQLQDFAGARSSLREWFFTAHRLDNVRGLIHGFYPLIDLAVLDKNYQQAGIWLGVIQGYARPIHLDAGEIARLTGQIQAAPEAIAEWIAWGRSRPLEATVADLLASADQVFGPDAVISCDTED